MLWPSSVKGGPTKKAYPRPDFARFDESTCKQIRLLAADDVLILSPGKNRILEELHAAEKLGARATRNFNVYRKEIPKS